MKLNAAKTHLTVKLNQSLSAFEVEMLIHQLAAWRARMVPEVPSEIPSASKRADDLDSVLIDDDPIIGARPLKNSGCRLWIRNRGIGWMVFNMSAELTSGLVSKMQGGR